MNTPYTTHNLCRTAIWHLCLLGHVCIDLLSFGLLERSHLRRVYLLRYGLLLMLGFSLWHIQTQPSAVDAEANYTYVAPASVGPAGSDTALPPPANSARATRLALEALHVYEQPAAKAARRYNVDSGVLLAAAIWEAELAGQLDLNSRPRFSPGIAPAAPERAEWVRPAGAAAAPGRNRPQCPLYNTLDQPASGPISRCYSGGSCDSAPHPAVHALS